MEKTAEFAEYKYSVLMYTKYNKHKNNMQPLLHHFNNSDKLLIRNELCAKSEILLNSGLRYYSEMISLFIILYFLTLGLQITGFT